MRTGNRRVHSSNLTPFAASMRRMALTMVVLPTPGRMLDYLESVEKGKRFLLLSFDFK
jgi:hypothetical protein